MFDDRPGCSLRRAVGGGPAWMAEFRGRKHQVSPVAGWACCLGLPLDLEQNLRDMLTRKLDSEKLNAQHSEKLKVQYYVKLRVQCLMSPPEP